MPEPQKGIEPLTAWERSHVPAPCTTDFPLRDGLAQRAQRYQTQAETQYGTTAERQPVVARCVAVIAALILTACAPLDPLLTPVTAYGDSLTAGTGAAVFLDWPSQLQARSARRIENRGVPGQTSTQIADRCVTDTGTGPVIVWMGTNNSYRPAEILADVARCAAHLGARLVVVLPVMTRPYEYRGRAEHALVTSTNDSLRARYGARFLDVRSRLIATGGAAAIAADTLPSAVRSDDVHLNADGYALVASWVAEVLP